MVACMKANKELSDNLQAVLVDLIELGNQGKQAHWNVVGPNFRGLHLQLDEIVADVREHSDVIAERMRALHATPDGRSSTVSKNTTLEPLPAGEIVTATVAKLITARLERVAKTVRGVHEAVDAADPTTADLLNAVIDIVEHYAWMVSAETQKQS